VNQVLSPATWPWVPGQTYYVLFLNTSGADQPVTFTMDGKNAQTEDEDNDGLPDAWEMKYFGNTWQYNDPLAEPNRDGVSLLMAYALNLDPTRNQAGSMPQVVRTGNQMSITFYSGTPGITYTVEASSDMLNWSTNGVMISDPDTNHFRTATVPMTGLNRFLRLRVSR